MKLDDLELPLPPIEFVLAEDCPALPTLTFTLPEAPEAHPLEHLIARALLGSCLCCGGQIAAVGCENDDCPNADERPLR